MLKIEGYKVIKEFDTWAERVFDTNRIYGFLDTGLFFVRSVWIVYGPDTGENVNHTNLQPKGLLLKMKEQTINSVWSESGIYPMLKVQELNEDDKGLLRGYLRKLKMGLVSIDSNTVELEKTRKNLKGKVSILQEILED